MRWAGSVRAALFFPGLWMFREIGLDISEKVATGGEGAEKVVTGNDLVVRELLRQGVTTGFFLMGGPMTPMETDGAIFKNSRLAPTQPNRTARLPLRFGSRPTQRVPRCICVTGNTFWPFEW